MRIREGDKWKTAFQIRYGNIEYQVMPFGPSNAPAIFQGYINKILAEKLDIFVIVYLDDILIYTKDLGQSHVEAVCSVLDQLRKYSLFANLKKCHFHQDEVCFLGYVVSSKGINMEVEQIEVVKKWPELKSVKDIQVFLGFSNFYWQFIQSFSRIAAPLTSMIKTTNKPAPSRNNGSKSVSNRNDDSKPAFERNDGNSEIDRFVGDGVEHAKKSRKSKSQKSAKSQKSSKSGKSKGKKSKKPPKIGNTPNFNAKDTGPSFLTPKARSALNLLRLAFIEVPILWYFNPECHIYIETNALGYAIGSVLSQLSSGTSLDEVVTKTDLGQWHPVAFFLRKIISAETQYNTHDGELLAIIEAF